MELKGLLYQHYEMFSRKLSGHCCKMTGEIDNFLVLLSKTDDVHSLGEWFAWNYVAFQFEFYSGKKTRLDGRIPANWIFGKKAIERWQKRDPTTWSYFVNKFLTEAEIPIPVDFHSASMDKDFERERKRFFNTDMGLLHCLQFARYSDRSASCLICKNKKQCKELWK